MGDNVDQHYFRVVHSSKVVCGIEFTVKNVVLVGLGESGSDMALLLAPHAVRLTLSVRANGSGHALPYYTEDEVSGLSTSRGYEGAVGSQGDHDKFASLVQNVVVSGDEKALRNLARCYIGSDSFREVVLMAIEWNGRYQNAPYNRYGTKNFSFLEAIRSHGVRVAGEITRIDDPPEDTDVVILCIGYQGSFPFFAQYLPVLNERACRHRDRYHYMIDFQISLSLTFRFSRPAYGAVPPLPELSARY